MTSTTTAPETETPADVLALKNLLLEAVKMACMEDGLCDTAVTRVWDKKTELGKAMAEIEKPRLRDFSSHKVTVTINGQEITLTGHVTAYDEAGATTAYLRQQGWFKPRKAEDITPPDSSNDSDEVKAFKAVIRDFIKEQKDLGQLNGQVANKYLRFLGIEELPIKQRYYFELLVEVPKTATVTYRGDGFSEEEARTNALVRIKEDNERVAAGQRRGRQDATSVEAARDYVAVEGAPLSLSTRYAPAVIG